MHSDLFIRPDFDNAKALITFTAPPNCDGGEWRILDAERTVSQGTFWTRPGCIAEIVADMPGFIPWSVHEPHLYTLRVDSAGSDSGRVEQRFGMRKIETRGRELFVNNQPFCVRGFVRGHTAHEHPNLLRLPEKEYYAKNIRMAKAFGYNLIRSHSTIPPQVAFEAADELGIFIHVEMRKYPTGNEERVSMMSEGKVLSEREWREVVLRLRNQPSLLAYCMGNEIDHPGRNPHCKRIHQLTKELDPTRLFIDTCARGEFDRTAVDFDVQFMSYFFPFGKHADMFEDTRNWLIYGSCKDAPLTVQDNPDDWAYRLTRTLPIQRPTVAHEICHYAALHDLDALAAKFDRAEAKKPWWIGELKKLIRAKGMESDYPKMVEASRHFQFVSWKLTIEAARRSRILNGFHQLQLSDTDRYENSNGPLDCFDDPRNLSASAFLKFNGDTVVLADLPRRTFFEAETIDVPVLLSHFSPEISGMADLVFTLTDKASQSVLMSDSLGGIDLSARGRREIARIIFRLPKDLSRSSTLSLSFELRGATSVVANEYDIWVYHDRPEQVPPLVATVQLDEVNLRARYPQIVSKGTLQQPEKLLIVNRFSDEVIHHLGRGGDVMLLYRVPETRDRKHPGAPREQLLLPATWDRFKPVIWDRGHNCGAFIRPSAALSGFPNNGVMDLQFAGLVDDADKVNLDDFPAPVEPIIQGIDKASRDRFDVYTYGLSDLQPAYTLRKFAYLFELKVGSGRLLVSGLNFTGLGRQHPPETCAMFESLLAYVRSDAFRPSAAISPQDLRDYLTRKGESPRPRERRMTQYWQLDEEPLESARYWKESIDYIGEPVVLEDSEWYAIAEKKAEVQVHTQTRIET